MSPDSYLHINTPFATTSTCINQLTRRPPLHISTPTTSTHTANTLRIGHLPLGATHCHLRRSTATTPHQRLTTTTQNGSHPRRQSLHSHGVLEQLQESPAEPRCRKALRIGGLLEKTFSRCCEHSVLVVCTPLWCRPPACKKSSCVLDASPH